MTLPEVSKPKKLVAIAFAVGSLVGVACSLQSASGQEPLPAVTGPEPAPNTSGVAGPEPPNSPRPAPAGPEPAVPAGPEPAPVSAGPEPPPDSGGPTPKAGYSYYPAVPIKPGDNPYGQQPGPYVPPNSYTPTPPPVYPDAQTQMDPRARSAAAWANLDRAKQMVQDGQAKEALTILKDFVISKPKEPEGYFWAGVAFDHSGQPTRALRAYMNSLTLSLDAGMDSAELRVNIGNALLKEGRVDEALTSFKRAVLIEPRLAIAHLSYARGLLEKGDAAEALVQLRRAADLNADSKQVSYYRLKALAKLGQKEEARAERKALIESTTDAVQKGKLQEEFKALD